MNTTQLRRDPFARSTLIRLLLPLSMRAGCRWCGSLGRFAYWWENDSLNGIRSHRPADRIRAFCSVSCFESFNT